MRVIIAGSRDFSDYQLLSDTMHSLFPNMGIEVVSGMARGADYLGYCFGKENGLVIHEMPADWNTYGKSAGFKRNAEMSKVGDILVAFWDGKSNGTGNMIRLMQLKGKPVHIVTF